MAALLGQAREHVVDVPDELDLGNVVLVDLGGHGIDHDDLLVAPGFQWLGRVLDEVIADAITTSASSKPAIA